MPKSSSEAAAITPYPDARPARLYRWNKKAGNDRPRLTSWSDGRGYARTRPTCALAPLLHGLANISFIISLSTSVVSDALSGIAGLHRPLTTGCIRNGTLT